MKELVWAFLAIAQLVYLLLRGKIEATEASRVVEELKKKYAENKLEIQKNIAGKSSDDIIDDFLKGKGPGSKP